MIGGWIPLSPESGHGGTDDNRPLLSILVLGTGGPAVASLLNQYHRQAPVELLTAQPEIQVPQGVTVRHVPVADPATFTADGLQRACGRGVWVLRSGDQITGDALERVLNAIVQRRRVVPQILPLRLARPTALPPVQLLIAPPSRRWTPADAHSQLGTIWALALSLSERPQIARGMTIGTAAPMPREERRRERQDASALALQFAFAKPFWSASARHIEATLPPLRRLLAATTRHVVHLVLDLDAARRLRRPPDWMPVAAAALAGLLVAWIGIHIRLGAFALAAMVAAVMTVAYLPRLSLVGIYGLLLFDGALRKWILRSGQQLIYFGKDALLLLLYLRQLVAGSDADVPPARPIPSYVRTPLLLFAAWLLLELFNPDQPSLTFWIFGLRVYLLPLALLVVLPALLTREQIDRLMTAFVLASIPIGLVATLQTLLGPDHWLNQYAWGSMDVARFGGRREGIVRATSTFSYITGYTSYLTTAGLLAPFAAHRLAPKRVAPLGLLYGWLLICAVLSGSRGPVLIIAAGAPLIALPLFARMDAAQIVRAWIAVTAALLVFGVLFRDPVEHFRNRVEQTRDVSSRLERLLHGPINAARMAGVFGEGLATEHQSRDILLRQSRTWKPLPPFVEEELSRVTLEIGAIGALLAWWFRIACGVMCLLWLRDAVGRQSTRDQLLLAAGLMMTIWTLVTSLFYDVTMYYGWATLLALARTTGTPDDVAR